MQLQFAGRGRRTGLLVVALLLGLLPHTLAQEPVDNRSALAAVARRNPLVAATLEQPRETPQQILRAIGRLLDLGHQETAALVLPELLNSELDDGQRAALVREFGVARFMQLMRLDTSGQGDDESFAGARQFAQSALDAAAATNQDPAAIADLIKSLQSADADQRIAATADLRTTGGAGAAGLLSALATEQEEPARGRLMQALASMQPAVDAPLLAALADGQGRFRRDVVQLAGELRLRGALPWLAALAAGPSNDAIARTALESLRQFGATTPPVPSDAEVLVRRGIDEALDGVLPIAVARAGEQWFLWDQENQRLETTLRPEQEIPLLYAARLSEALSELNGSASLAGERMAIMLAWEAAALREQEPSAEIAAAVDAMSPVDLSQLLLESLEHEHFAAAARAASELGERQDFSALLTPDGHPSPLAEALDSVDRNARFAALKAIMQINPQATFPGSSRVVDALWYFANGAGAPTAVVAAPNATLATTWAGQLSSLGIDASAAGTGRSALLEATDLSWAPRLALVVVDDRIGRPAVRETVYQLRVHPRTAGVPALVLSPSDRMASLQSWAEADPRTMAAPRPYSEAAMQALAEQARSLSASPLAAEDVRREQAKQALAWIHALNDAESPYDQLVRDAELLAAELYDPELSGPTLKLLATVGDSASQRTLLDYANAAAADLESRRLAVDAFAQNVERFGVQLTRAQILDQYDRYNASESADSPTQQLLSRVLDLIEGKETSNGADPGPVRP